MPKNSSGKIITVFLSIVAFLLISLTAISIFFFQKEIDRRKTAEIQLLASQNSMSRLEGELKESKKQTYLLEEKNKDADERINSLLDELELQEALKKEMKTETTTLKEQLDKEVKAKEDLRKQLLDDVAKAEQKVIELEAKLQAEINRPQEVKTVTPEKETEEVASSSVSEPVEEKKEIVPSTAEAEKDIDLDKIVVVPHEVPEGRVISVDTDTDFVIVNLGQDDGVELGNVMSIYRGNEYLGDIKVTRVQSEMLAADLIPPFSSRIVRKNDQVVIKQ
jgi:hypothetical protein